MTETFKQYYAYSDSQDQIKNPDLYIQKTFLRRYPSDSIDEIAPTNIPSRSIRVEYFKLIYKEDFVEFLQKQKVTEESWYNTREIDRMSFYSEYDKHIQIQKYKKDAEKEKEEKEKAMETLKEKEQESLRVIEKERERADKAEKALMEFLLERAEKERIEKEKESKEMNTTNKLLEGNQEEDKSEEQTNDKTNKNDDPSNKTTNMMTDNKQEEETKILEKTKSKGFGVYTCIEFSTIDEQENLFRNIESATKDLQRILIDIVNKTKESYESDNKLSAYNLNKDYDKSARHLVDAFNIPNELSNEWARLTEICETNDKACRALYLEFQKALTLIIDYSKRMSDNNRDLQVQKEESDKKLVTIQSNFSSQEN